MVRVKNKSTKTTIDRILKMKCPFCGKRRLFPGPGYDRWKLRCWNCGKQFRGKPKEKK